MYLNMITCVHFHLFSQIKLFPCYEQQKSLNRIKHINRYLINYIYSYKFHLSIVSVKIYGEFLSNATHIYKTVCLLVLVDQRFQTSASKISISSLLNRNVSPVHISQFGGHKNVEILK